MKEGLKRKLIFNMIKKFIKVWGKNFVRLKDIVLNKNVIEKVINSVLVLKTKVVYKGDKGEVTFLLLAV